jgi:hypothetical protein
LRSPDVIEGASVRCYPRDDAEFAADVTAALASEGPDRDAVINSLKVKYPQVRIFVRDSLASMRGEPEVWYCYREGRLVAA